MYKLILVKLLSLLNEEVCIKSRSITFFLPLFCPPSWFWRVAVIYSSSSVAFLDYWHLHPNSQIQKPGISFTHQHPIHPKDISLKLTESLNCLSEGSDSTNSVSYWSILSVCLKVSSYVNSMAYSIPNKLPADYFPDCIKSLWWLSSLWILHPFGVEVLESGSVGWRHIGWKHIFFFISGAANNLP